MTKTIKKYLLVAKPGVVLGNMVSVAGGFLLAARGHVDVGKLLWTIVSVSLVVASGCVFNNWIDRDLDRKMIRTRHRVLPRGLMSPAAALVYGALLGIGGTLFLWAAANKLCVAIVMAGLVIYVGLYSLYLKRRTVYAALIGSLAGAAPPLAGYCAVSGRLDPGALILLILFSLWQVPHAHAIAVFRRRDYAAASIPVLPVKRGVVATRHHILGFILAFTAAAMMLTFGGYTGRGFLGVAVAVGLSWLWIAWSGYRASVERRWARRLFVFSIVGIAALSVMMAVDFATPHVPELLLSCAP